MKKARVYLAGLLTMGAIVGQVCPVSAASKYVASEDKVVSTQTIENEDTTKECKVYAEVASTFTAEIPKEITLDGVTKQGHYAVAVAGDTAGDEYIKVKPDATFALKQDGKADVTAVVVQPKDAFRGDNYTAELKENEAYFNADGKDAELKFTVNGEEKAVSALGAIYADGTNEAGTITAGSWEGVFNFAISLETDAAVE